MIDHVASSLFPIPSGSRSACIGDRDLSLFLHSPKYKDTSCMAVSFDESVSLFPLQYTPLFTVNFLFPDK